MSDRSGLALSPLLDNLPGMVYRCKNDRDWTLSFASSGALALTGYAPDVLTSEHGVRYGELIHPDDRDAVFDGVQAAVQRGQPFHLSYRIITADATVKWVAEQGSAVYAPTGELLALEGFVSDITERKEAEEALRQSAALLLTQSETLTTISESLAAYLDHSDWKSAFSQLLRGALSQTQSEYGFIGVVVEGARLRVLAFEGIVWDQVVNREFYERAMASYAEEGYLVFDSFDNLFGRAITTGQVMIANQPEQHAHAAGRPQGHPPMHSFLGVPIHAGDKVCGLVALANRPGGYALAQQQCIEMLVKYAGGLCVTYLQQEKAQMQTLEREKALQALQESEARFLELARNIDEVFYSFDAATTRVYYVSPSYETVWGRSCDTLYTNTRTIRESVHPQDRQKTHETYVRQCAGVPTEQQFRIVRPDGEVRWVVDRAYPVTDEHGRVIRIVGTALDITERKLAEQALNDSEKRYSALFESGPAPMWVFDDSTRAFLAVNAAATQEYGYTQAEFLSMTLYDLRPASEHAVLDHLLALGPANPQDAPRSPVLHRRKDGSELWVQPISRYVDYAGRAARFVVAYNVSAQVKAENDLQSHLVTLEQKVAERTAALARQEALFRALAEQAPEVIWTVDARGQLTYLNRRWYELMGGTAADWLGARWFEALHPEDQPEVAANWKRVSKTGEAYTGVRRLLALDGVYHTMSYRAAPVFDDAGAIVFWVGVDADISGLKATEDALRRSNQELETFSYSVSHDLRSPLNTVAGFSSLLARHLEASGDPRVQHYVSRIQAGVGQMGQLIEGLLALAQVSRVDLRSDPVDLSELAVEIAERLRSREPQRDVLVDIENGLAVQGDVRLLRSVMDNLLGNAWKFSSGRAQARITVGRSETSAAFFVSDNGAGFDMAYADKLFGTFQRLHAVSEFPGTGVGLATVSRIIQRHGGRIWADARPSEGATFYFTLPLPHATASAFAELL